jgi:orotate phosphoribosyltransferase
MALTNKDELLQRIWHEAIDFDVSGRNRLAFKANEDQGAPHPPSKLQFRSPALGGRMSGTLLDLIGQVLWGKLKALISEGLTFGYIAGVPRAGDPIVDALLAAAQAEGREFERVFLGKQQFGQKRTITGVTLKGWKADHSVLLVDDLVTHGGSKLEAVRVLRTADLDPVYLLVLVDREQGGAKELRANGLHTHSAMSWPQMMAYYSQVGLMTDDQLQSEESYRMADAKYWKKLKL